MRNRIREHRKRRGLTLDELAELVGMSKGYLSDLETGKRTGGLEMLRLIAQALKVSELEIFSPENADDQAMLDHLAIFQQLSPEDKAAVAKIARGLLSQND